MLTRRVEARQGFLEVQVLEILEVFILEPQGTMKILEMTLYEVEQ